MYLFSGAIMLRSYSITRVELYTYMDHALILNIALTRQENGKRGKAGGGERDHWGERDYSKKTPVLCKFIILQCSGELDPCTREPALLLCTRRVRAPRTAQAHLDARRSECVCDG